MAPYPEDQPTAEGQESKVSTLTDLKDAEDLYASLDTSESSEYDPDTSDAPDPGPREVFDKANVQRWLRNISADSSENCDGMLSMSNA